MIKVSRSKAYAHPPGTGKLIDDDGCCCALGAVAVEMFGPKVVYTYNHGCDLTDAGFLEAYEKLCFGMLFKMNRPISSIGGRQDFEIGICRRDGGTIKEQQDIRNKFVDLALQELETAGVIEVVE